MSDSLSLLKEELSQSGSVGLLDDSGASTTDITNATTLYLKKQDKKFPLDEETIYATEGGAVSLKVACFAWLNKDLDRADYIELADSKKVGTLGVLQRTDLTEWIAGTKPEFEFSSRSAGETDESGDSTLKDAKTKETDPFLEAVLANERSIADHNSSLRGAKAVDFSNAAEMCKRAFLIEPKKGSKRSTDAAESSDGKKSKRPVTPIILISPSASSLLTMANVKAFLENGKYINPNTTNPEEQEYLSSADLAMVTHTFPRLGKRTFMVVNSIEKFSKTEHWDRTVAVFTTGQKWQFKLYQWSEPQELFSHIKGYYFHFDKDPIAPGVKDWNVERIALDKHKRFRDIVVLNNFWDSLEKAMISRGYK